MTARYIVVDLNTFQNGMARQIIQPHDRAVFSKEIYFDMGKSPDRDTHIKCFSDFAEDHQNRICFAKSPGELESLELSMKPVTDFTWIDWQYTEKFRKYGQASIDWTGFVTGKELPDFQTKRQLFLDMCHQISALMKADEGDYYTKNFRQSRENIMKIIREPFLGSNVAQTIGLCRGEKWKQALDVFPDIFAVGRWSRIINWYGLCHAGDYTKGFKNNFDDAFYAFTASYAGHILTKDKGLICCVEAVFPHVKILDH